MDFLRQTEASVEALEVVAQVSVECRRGCARHRGDRVAAYADYTCTVPTPNVCGAATFMVELVQEKEKRAKVVVGGGEIRIAKKQWGGQSQ